MSDDSSPALGHVNLAREHAKLDNYDASLRSYTHAQQEIECEIDLCRDRGDLVKWNSMLKDVKAEEAAIRRIKDTLDEILSSIDEDDTSVFSQPQGDGDEAIEPPQWSRAEQNTDEASTTRKERRPIQQNVQKPRRIAVNRGNTAGGGGRSGIASRGQQQKAIQRNKQCNNNVQKQLQNAKQNQQHQQPEEEGSNQRPALDPSTNPLAQQIIDMGILIREPNVQWDQIAGLAQVKRLLRQNLVILPMRPDICKGLLAPWKSVLFYGPPGTGKTFLAKAVATECRRTFFNVTSATITSKWHGESEKLVSHLFTLAEQMAPSTIFFDEIDSVASQRGGGNENEASRKMKAQLLTKLEGIDSATESSQVFVLAATNFPWDLDEALLRRFQKRIYIPLPDVEGRLSILKMNIQEMIDDEFDLQMWAERLEGYSCADIANLCRDAAQAVFDKQTENLDANEWMNMPLEQARIIIRDEDFERAVKLRKSSVDQSTLKKYDEWRLTKGAE